MSLYWLNQTLAVLPLALWVYVGLGIPWALLLLPRTDWQRRVDVLALSFAVGPALLTAWMLILGTIGGARDMALLSFDWVFSGTVVIALAGYGLMWRKALSSTVKSDTEPRPPLAFDERLLIGLLVIAVLVRWVVTSYWSFTAYDALWVYGYQGRLYQMLGYIPETIGYYPQFLSLQFTFMQSLTEGFDDHAARAVIPFLHVGSIMAAYVLGSRLFTRRAGIFAAAIWAFYPHVAQWAHIGDLEIPLTFTLTLTIAFFLLAWRHNDRALRRQYALIAGVCFGIAMWTKPTAGAFIWGVILLVAIEFLRVRGDWRRWYPRFEVALITGLACIPLGAVWYVRNVALGLPALVFPNASWLARATRSGDLLSFPVLALLLAIAYKASKGQVKHGWVTLAGVLLLLAGTMPSSPLISEALGVIRRDPPASYMMPLEIGLVIAGAILVAWGWRERLVERAGDSLSQVGWAYALILPYFVTWFWSYSYHARLSFPIVPVLLLPSAVILARWFPQVTIQRLPRAAKVGFGALLFCICVPGIITPITGIADTHDWLWTDRYPTDFERTQVFNPGVSLVAEQLWGYQAFHGETPIVIAPGEQRLRFFLPDATIITDTLPMTYEELEGATHYLYGTLARWRYEDDEGISPLDNRIVASLGREEYFNRVLRFRGGSFSYDLYDLTLDNTSALGDTSVFTDEVIFGDAVRHVAEGASNNQLQGNRIAYDIFFEVLAPLDGNYHLQTQLVNIETGTVYDTWTTPFAPSEHSYYNTALWEVGEIVRYSHSVQVDTSDLPRGVGNYRFVVNFVEIDSGEILPVTINSEAADDGYPMLTQFSVGN